MSNTRNITMSLKYSKEERTSIYLTVGVALLLFVILYFIRFIETQTAHSYFGGGGGGGTGVEIALEGTPAPYATEEHTPAVEPVKEIVQPVETVKEEPVIAYEKNNDAPVVINKTEKTKADKKVVVTDKPVVKKTEVKEVKKVEPVAKKPDVSNSTKDALSSLMNGSKGGTGNGGNGNNPNGGLSGSGGYYGVGHGSGTGSGTGSGVGPGTGTGTGGGSGSGTGTGVGGGIGYSLEGRAAIVKPTPKYLCNEVGKVVVEVWVDQSGNTVDARAGVKGSTNTVKCLIDQARIAAMQTKWQPNTKAPERQVGTIVYNFSLN